LRDELSVRLYGVEFDELDKDQRKDIQKKFPQKISEAEQLKVGA
jgi:hypothetical protein